MRAPRKESDSLRRSLLRRLWHLRHSGVIWRIVALGSCWGFALEGRDLFRLPRFPSMARMLLQAGHLFTILCGRQSSHNRPLTNRQTIGIEKSASVYKSDPPGRKTGFS